jgi:hypothetical protein
LKNLQFGIANALGEVQEHYPKRDE